MSRTKRRWVGHLFTYVKICERGRVKDFEQWSRVYNAGRYNAFFPVDPVYTYSYICSWHAIIVVCNYISGSKTRPSQIITEEEAGYRYGHGYFPSRQCTATPSGSDTIGIRRDGLSATGTQSVFTRHSPYGLSLNLSNTSGESDMLTQTN